MDGHHCYMFDEENLLAVLRSADFSAVKLRGFDEELDRQDRDYKKSVLPDGVPRIAVEAGVTDFWWKYGCAAVVGIDTFGESAPANVLFKHFGFTAENVADTVRAVLQHQGA